jgi:hypothetical protein
LLYKKLKAQSCMYSRTYNSLAQYLYLLNIQANNIEFWKTTLNLTWERYRLLKVHPKVDSSSVILSTHVTDKGLILYDGKSLTSYWKMHKNLRMLKH